MSEKSLIHTNYPKCELQLRIKSKFLQFLLANLSFFQIDSSKGRSSRLSHFSDESLIGMADWSGYAGYYSTRHIINIDGVVNNKAYDAIRNGTLLTYMINQGIIIVYPNTMLVNQVFMGSDNRAELVDTGRGFYIIRQLP